MTKCLFSFLFLVAVAYSQTAAGASVTLTFSNQSDALIGSGSWTAYTNTPAAFTIDSFAFNPNDVLHVVTRQTNQPGGQNQGYYYNTPVGTTSIWFDFYVDPAGWNTLNVNSGVWGYGLDSTGQPTLAPAILGYEQGDGRSTSPGFYANENSVWDFMSAGNSGWNTLEMDIDPGVGINYSVNGIKMDFVADPTIFSFDKLLVNSLAGRSGQDFYYDNVGMAKDPVPLFQRHCRRHFCPPLQYFLVSVCSSLPVETKNVLL